MFYLCPGKRFDLDVCVIDDVAEIVKMPLAMKTVGINC
jgi:hypothetical protein